MSKTKKRNSSRKGDYGYLASEKKRRILITAVLFAVPLLIFFSAMLYFHTRLTIWTVIAVVGCLPEPAYGWLDSCTASTHVVSLFHEDLSVHKPVFHPVD